MDKGMSCVQDGTEPYITKFHCATQNSIQFETYELFTSRIFYLIFSDHGWLQATKTMESKTLDKGEGTAAYKCTYTFKCVCVWNLWHLYTHIWAFTHKC